MQLLSLYLRNFRNYEEASLAFAPGLNYIYGENAQGKTNLLEAIHLLITGRSFRTHHLKELIRFGAKSFYLEAHFEKNGVKQVIKVTYDGEKRTIIHNATPLPSVSSLLGILHGVIVSPEDRELIKGGPAARRHFLDLQISCESPLYLYHLNRYTKAMKQRNALLKRRKPETIEIWEVQMAESASYLTTKRREVVSELSKSGELNLTYHTSTPKKVDADYFVRRFAKLRPKELEYGTTLTGPHRDDLHIFIDDKEARFFASEGQTRLCVTNMRLAQWARLKSATDETPLLCIDDVGISLDAKKEQRLYERLTAYGQVFITSPQTNPQLDAYLIGVNSGRFSL